MIEQYKEIYEGGTDEIVEKKSRFIATVFPVKAEQEAVRLIEETKKKNWDARHNCFAYVIGPRHELQRFSDDGEPSGTAGKPILDVLLGEDVHNALIIVTRYFGGTLLGTGGLVRAYQGASKAGLLSSQIITKKSGSKILIKTDYNNVGKIQYIFGQMEIDVLESEYTDEVQFTIAVEASVSPSLEKKIQEATSATASYEKLDDIYYAKTNGQVLLFDE
ncbi:MAG: YigZ family protein [bacterium]|nr:YigZ family protein [bacterium]